MKLLVTGKGTSGSWTIRGEQLGRALGATVRPRAERVDGYDLVVLVKRPTPDLLERLQRAGARIVWDIVDAWPQPEGNRWLRAQCIAWLRAQAAQIRPVGIVAATQAMAVDCRSCGVPVLALPHHARPAMPTNEIRKDVQVIGYEGSEAHLGPSWIAELLRTCRARGWRFVINPRRLSDLDIVVAMREVRGYAPMRWKSNVKLANAQGSGTPIVCAREAGYLETQSGGETWADEVGELEVALDHLTPWSVRRYIAELMVPRAPRLVQIAEGYRTWLHELSKS